MGAHARNSPSALHRTLNCTPSLVLGEQFADEESSYAAEGSAGHALAEHLIKKHLNFAPNARCRTITQMTSWKL